MANNTTHFPLEDMVYWLCPEKGTVLSLWDIPKRKVGQSFWDGASNLVIANKYVPFISGNTKLKWKLYIYNFGKVICVYNDGFGAGVNVLCGVGILSTPYAVREGGWYGLSILFIFAMLSFYTGILLRHCLDSQPGLETYPDIGQAAFGTVGRIVISVSLTNKN